MIFTLLGLQPLFFQQLIPTAWWTALVVVAHLAPWAPRCRLAVGVHRAINNRPEHAAGHHLLSVVEAATNNWASLNPALANADRLKTSPSSPLCLPEVLFSEYPLNWPAYGDNPLGSDNSRPPGPDSHAGRAHRSAVLCPTEPRRQAYI